MNVSGGAPLFEVADGFEGCRLGPVWGTVWHGVLENDDWRRAVLYRRRARVIHESSDGPTGPVYRLLWAAARGLKRAERFDAAAAAGRRVVGMTNRGRTYANAGAQAWGLLGTLEAARGRYEEAEQAFRAAEKCLRRAREPDPRYRFCLLTSRGALRCFLSRRAAGRVTWVCWHYGFAATGVGMTLSLIQYIAGQRHLRGAGKLRGKPEDRSGSDAKRELVLGLAVVVAFAATLISRASSGILPMSLGCLAQGTV